MTEPQISSHKPPRRRWLWLFAALLPIALLPVALFADDERDSVPLGTVQLADKLCFVNALAWAPDNCHVAATCRNKLVIVSSIGGFITKRLGTGFRGISSRANQLQFAPDGKTLFMGNKSVSDFNYVRAFDVSSGRLKRGFACGPYFHIAGSRLFSLGHNEKPRHAHGRKQLRFTSLIVQLSTNVRSHEVPLTIEDKTPYAADLENAGIPATARWSPDGNLVATEFEDWRGTSKADFHYESFGLQVFDVKSGRLRHQLDAGGSFEFSPDGKLLFAVGAGDGPTQLRGWRTDTGNRVIALNIGEHINNFIIAPDGQSAATFQSGYQFAQIKTITFWDLNTRQATRKIENPDAINSAAFSPDGHTLAVGGENGTLTFWRVK